MKVTFLPLVEDDIGYNTKTAEVSCHDNLNTMAKNGSFGHYGKLEIGAKNLLTVNINDKNKVFHRFCRVHEN